MFDQAVAAALPKNCLPPHLPEIFSTVAGRVVIIAAGKAAASMAAVVAAHAGRPLTGLAVTRYGHAVPVPGIAVVEAGHPYPDSAGTAAAERILELVSGLGPDDLVLCLLSGGGSALLTLPAAGVTLADKQAMTRALLRSGAAIHEINTVRKHLSRIKGGRLAAAAHPARVISLIISDVPGDDPATVASGPTVGDPTTCADALAVLARYGIEQPRAILDYLRAAKNESLKPGDRRLANSRAVIVASAGQALEAAATTAAAAGYRPIILGDAIEGESRTVAATHAAMALRYAAGAEAVALISGGETTVTVRGQGRGGRNGEYALALAIALAGRPGIDAIACDTDGIDGSEDNAGALAGPDTLAQGRAAGLDAGQCLDDNDAYGFFRAVGGLVVTGPTLTNVNDFRAILVAPPPKAR
jgi:glycerate 2-kinase